MKVRSGERGVREPAFQAALESGRPTLLHLKLPAEVITSRTTLAAIREAALAKKA